MAGADPCPLVTMPALRKATIARVLPVLPGWSGYPEWPDMASEPVEKPAALIAPGHSPVDYEKTTFGGNTAEWSLVLTLMVDGVDHDAAQDQLGELTAPTGVVVRALRARRKDDAFGRMVLRVRLTMLSAFESMNAGGDLSYFSQYRVLINA